MVTYHLFFFSKQCLVENIQEKFEKQVIGNFYFWGITLTAASKTTRNWRSNKSLDQSPGSTVLHWKDRQWLVTSLFGLYEYEYETTKCQDILWHQSEPSITQGDKSHSPCQGTIKSYVCVPWCSKIAFYWVSSFTRYMYSCSWLPVI